MFSDQMQKPARKTAKDKVFSEWQEATKKVSMGKSKTNGKETNSDKGVYARPPINPDFVHSFGALAKESAALSKEDILDNEKPNSKFIFLFQLGPQTGRTRCKGIKSLKISDLLCSSPC